MSTTSFAQKALLVFCGTLVALSAGEISTRIYDRIRHGSSALQWTSNVYDRINPSDCKFEDSLIAHPYVGYVFSMGRRCSMQGVHQPGFDGPAFPDTKPSDSFVLLASGGSVADLCLRPRAHSDHPELQDILNREYFPPVGKRFIVLNGAAGGWKEPQQRFLFELYSSVIHGFISLEGYNEFKIVNTGYSFNYVASDFWYLNPLYNDSLPWVAWTAVLDQVHRAILSHALLRASHLVHTVFFALEKTRSRPDRDPLGPSQALFGTRSNWDRNIATYREDLTAMHRLAKAEGIKDAYFLQPVPALSKPLTDEEKKAAGDLSYGPRYRKMASALGQLSSEGVPIISLTDLFAEVDRTLYMDDIHYFGDRPNGQPNGCDLVSQSIATTLGKLWKLRPRT